MNFKTVLITSIFFLPFLFSINAQESQKDFSLAKVGKKIRGVYVFIRSEPYHEYDFIATIKLKRKELGLAQENFETIIENAMKKYPYFNGLIFNDEDFSKVDIIRFKDLGVSRGGISVGSKVSFISLKRIYYGEVVQLEKDRGTVRYLNIFDEDKIKSIYYTKLTPVSEEEYILKKEDFKKKIEKYKFKKDDKVTWITDDKSHFGIVFSVDNTKHRATVKYINIFDEEKISEVKYLELEKITEEEYNLKIDEFQKEIAKYKFDIGEKVSWISGNETEYGEIVKLNNTLHRASIKYLNIYTEEKIKSIPFLNLLKVSEEDFKIETEKKINESLKYKFEIGEKVTWTKKSKQYTGQVIELNDNVHKASVKYIDKNNVHQIDKVKYLNLNKVE